MKRCLILSIAIAVGWGLTHSASAELVGYWPLNRNANEATGNNIDLNLVGDAGFGASVHAGLGTALSLDGDGDGAIGQNFVKFNTTSATVVAWAYAASLDGEWNTIVKNWGQDVGGQFHLGVGNTVANTLQNHAAGIVAVTDDADLPANEWVHTAFVVDKAANEHRLYINGQLAFSVATDPLASLGLGTATGLGIGHKPNNDGSDLATNGPGPWNGLIDEVGMYNEALSAEQIAQIYQNGLAGIQLDGTSVPEPSSFVGALLMAAGLAGYSARSRQRKAN